MSNIPLSLSTSTNLQSTNLPSRLSEKNPLKRSLGVLSIAAISFFGVSGGPYGSEGMFAAGPVWGVCGILAFSIGVGWPQCLVTVELSAAMPHNSGFALWTREAFGDFWAVQMIYWQWIGGVVDAALYPVIIHDSATKLLEGTVFYNYVAPYEFRMIIVAVLAFPLFFSARGVHNAFMIVTLFSLGPLLLFVLVTAPKIDVRRWTEGFTLQSISYRWQDFIFVLYWSFEGWDCVSTCVDHIKGPKVKALKSGLFISLLVVPLIYIVVFLSIAGVADDCEYGAGMDCSSLWKDGALVSIGKETVGPWMGVSIMSATFFSNGGLFLADVFEDTNLLQGTADAGLVPKIFAWSCCGYTTGASMTADEEERPPPGAPIVSIAFEIIILMFLVCLNFEPILMLDNAFCALSVVLEFITFYTLHRNFTSSAAWRVPVGLLWLPAVGIVISVLVLGLVFKSMSWLTVGLTVLVLLVGSVHAFWISNRAAAERRAGHMARFDNVLDS